MSSEPESNDDDERKDESSDEENLYVPQARPPKKKREEIRLTLKAPARTIRVFAKKRGPTRIVVIQEVQGDESLTKVRESRSLSIKYLCTARLQWPRLIRCF